MKKMPPEILRQQDLLRCRRDTYYLITDLIALEASWEQIKAFRDIADEYTRMLREEEKSGTPQKWITYHEIVGL